jgi:hypothetical protein
MVHNKNCGQVIAGKLMRFINGSLKLRSILGASIINSKRKEKSIIIPKL